MNILLQHLVVVTPSVAAVLVAWLNRRTLREVKITLNGRLDKALAEDRPDVSHPPEGGS